MTWDLPIRAIESGPLTDREIEELNAFLHADDSLENAMDVSTFDGFICAVLSGPNTIMPSEWLRWVWDEEQGEQAPEFLSERQAKRILSLLIGHANLLAFTLTHGPQYYEPLFYAHVTGEKDPWYGDKSQSTLWEEKKPAANRLHPTMKPVELIERALLNSSKSRDIVVDLFGGSGSTLIACERRGRSARLMEIDPKYADVIVRRWQEYTGNPAVLQTDGRTFEDIARERLQAAA